MEDRERDGELAGAITTYVHVPLMSMGVLVLLVTILGARSSEMSR